MTTWGAYAGDGSRRVTVANVDGGAITLNTDTTGLATEATLLPLTAGEYETVAASQTAQVLGGAGALDDYLARVIIIPASLSPGAVTLIDNATSITLFAGGASSLTELKPIVVEIGAHSASGAWKITTGANVSVIAVGNFTA